jgi:hypothetical protein
MGGGGEREREREREPKSSGAWVVVEEDPIFSYVASARVFEVKSSPLSASSCTSLTCERFFVVLGE